MLKAEPAGGCGGCGQWRRQGNGLCYIGGTHGVTRPMEEIVLRQWRDSDLEPYAAMNSDPEVMRYFPRPFSREESAASLERLRDLIEQRGWGLWVVEVDGRFAGFTGLAEPLFAASFMPCVEVGWRLRREFWGRGIAYRAARCALDYGFGALKLREVVSFTTVANTRSRRLMERLAFRYNPAEDFDHPAMPPGHALRRHVLYRKQAPIQSLRETAAEATQPTPAAFLGEGGAFGAQCRFAAPMHAPTQMPVHRAI